MLYIHPFGGPLEEVVPVGVIGLMNSIEAPRRGVYSQLLTEETLASASIFLLDLHWYHHLFSLERVVEYLRSARPEVPIVVGGYTATVFAEELVRAKLADYVLIGDTELPFEELMRRLLQSRDVSDVPNLAYEGHDNPPLSSMLTPEVFDSVDYVDLSWFPELNERVRQSTSRFHPVIVTHKGCPPGRT